MSAREELAKSISLELGEPGWMMEKRLESLKIFESIESPKKFVYGSGIITELELDLDKISLEEPVINIKTDSAEGVEVLSVEQATKTIPEELAQKLFSTTNNSEKILSMHNAFANSITIVRVKKNISKDFHIDTFLEKGSLFRHLLIILEENSSITMIDSKSSAEENKDRVFSNVVEVFAKPNSRINFVCISNLSAGTCGFSKKTGKALKDAAINFEEFIIGGRFLKAETQNYLLEHGAQGFITGAFINSASDVCDIKTDSLHISPDTKSDILIKGIVDESSKTVYRGLVKIFPKANRSSGYQKQDTLFLSRTATASSVPNLEIDTNNVRCSHGATTGQIDSSQLFYLMSRGISKQEAAKLVIKGFLSPVVERIKSDKLKNSILDLAMQKVKSF